MSYIMTLTLIYVSYRNIAVSDTHIGQYTWPASLRNGGSTTSVAPVLQ